MSAPSAAAETGSPSAPSWAGERCGGASAKRLTSPPSWSVATRRGGLPPFSAARCRRSTSAETSAGAAPEGGKRITPPIRPARAARTRPGVALAPIRTIRRWPTSSSSVTLASGSGGGEGHRRRRPRRTRARRGSRRRPPRRQSRRPRGAGGDRRKGRSRGGDHLSAGGGSRRRGVDVPMAPRPGGDPEPRRLRGLPARDRRRTRLSGRGHPALAPARPRAGSTPSAPAPGCSSRAAAASTPSGCASPWTSSSSTRAGACCPCAPRSHRAESSPGAAPLPCSKSPRRPLLQSLTSQEPLLASNENRRPLHGWIGLCQPSSSAGQTLRHRTRR